MEAAVTLTEGTCDAMAFCGDDMEMRNSHPEIKQSTAETHEHRTTSYMDVASNCSTIALMKAVIPGDLRNCISK